MILLVQVAQINIIGDGSSTNFVIQTDKLITNSLVSGRPSAVLLVAAPNLSGTVSGTLNESGSELTLVFSVPPPAPNPNTGLQFGVQIDLAYPGN